jgi:osmotically-inducible protein OsmY
MISSEVHHEEAWRVQSGAKFNGLSSSPERNLVMSDAAEPLTERIDSAIHRSPYLVGHTVRIEMRAGRVVLSGVVPSFYQKQIAQEVVRSVEGVERVDNQLQVDWSETSLGWAETVV